MARAYCSIDVVTNRIMTSGRSSKDADLATMQAERPVGEKMFNLDAHPKKEAILTNHTEWRFDGTTLVYDPPAEARSYAALGVWLKNSLAGTVITQTEYDLIKTALRAAGVSVP